MKRLSGDGVFRLIVEISYLPWISVKKRRVANS